MHRRVDAFPPVEDDDADVFASPASDLLLRTLEPGAFEAQLRMEAPTAPFKYTRRFLVLDARGNYLVKTMHGVCDDPVHVPSHAMTSKTRAMVKLLDLIELVPLIAPQVRPRRFARARWSSGPNTWLDIETLPFSGKALAQELYVATAHSWRLVDAIKLASWDLYKTETALWEANPAVIQYRATLAHTAERESVQQGQRESPRQEKAAVLAARTRPADSLSASSDKSSARRKRPRMEQAARQRATSPDGICVKRRQPSTHAMPEGINLASLVPGASSDIVIISLDSDSDSDSDVASPPPAPMQTPPVIELLDSPAAVHSARESPIPSAATAQSVQVADRNAKRAWKLGAAALNENLALERSATVDKEAPPSPHAPASVSWSPASPENLSNASTSDEKDTTGALTTVPERDGRKQSPPPDDLLPPHVSPDDDDLIPVQTTRKHHNVILDDDDDDELTCHHTTAPAMPHTLQSSSAEPERFRDVAPVPSSRAKDSAPETLAPDVVPDAPSPTSVPNAAIQPPSILAPASSTQEAMSATTRCKMALFQPIPQPVARWACPCGNPSPVKPHASSFLVCRTRSCGAWMHRMCVPPSTVYCPQCAPPPRCMTMQAFQSALWQASATNNVVWLEQLLATTSCAIDWTYAYRGDTCVLVAAKTDSMQVLLRLLALLPVATWPTHVSRFHNNVLHLTRRTKHVSAVVSIIARCPQLLSRLNAVGLSPMALYMQQVPHLVASLLQHFVPLRTIVDDVGNTWAHYLCVSLPDNFATLLALLPPVQLNVFNAAMTPLMLLCQNKNVTAAHMDLVVRLQPHWFAMDSRGYSAVHWLVLAKNAPLLRHLPISVVHTSPNLYAAAIFCNDEAAVGVLQELQMPLCVQQGVSGPWPIAMATTASMARALLSMDPLPQLEYVYSVSTQKADPPVVLRLLLDDMALGEYLNSLVARDLQAAKCGFFQRYRSVLCVDHKLVQLQDALRNHTAAQPANTVMHVGGRDQWWTSFVDQVKSISDWRQPIQFIFHGDTTVRSTQEASTCSDLWVQLQTVFATGNLISGNLLALGLLLGHMVWMRQTISSPRLPLPLLRHFVCGHAATGSSLPPIAGFVHWNAVATSDAAATIFRKGFRHVVGDLLEGWHALEVSVLLHSMTAFPVPLEAWQASVESAAHVVVGWWWQFLRTLRPIELYMVYSCVGGDKPVEVVLLNASSVVVLRDGAIGLPTVESYAELALRVRQALRNPLI
ncbi:hypothetical protein SPRG_03273 [Saprolegnia parasitica CBS 223.65]|uniref:Zinc finger PHD-type domain-containing protein n=1 Tax=Saprolegnia parasitica (strain CBS 223.65) TaxID=695850 RepID=A0A067CS30_SAPPC|nr:hypothetical protein SPRG_03273 [Saprolegnia parasitica CBS 223.65]KDO32055.1 hypothetical protein SPRG_03273 [Saprolegnia parasitica CBS 223.65]|eukprot:XP_012197243.1 hypothetical protein SPRG_03273 [Saprolegnia parasitica CBS 223.65]